MTVKKKTLQERASKDTDMNTVFFLYKLKSPLSSVKLLTNRIECYMELQHTLINAGIPAGNTIRASAEYIYSIQEPDFKYNIQLSASSDIEKAFLAFPIIRNSKKVLVPDFTKVSLPEVRMVVCHPRNAAMPMEQKGRELSRRPTTYSEISVPKPSLLALAKTLFSKKGPEQFNAQERILSDSSCEL